MAPAGSSSAPHGPALGRLPTSYRPSQVRTARFFCFSLLWRSAGVLTRGRVIVRLCGGGRSPMSVPVACPREFWLGVVAIGGDGGCAGGGGQKPPASPRAASSGVLAEGSRWLAKVIGSLPSGPDPRHRRG